jgi:hypothetical protein
MITVRHPLRLLRWWHGMGCHVTKAGIVRDLEAFTGGLDRSQWM